MNDINNAQSAGLLRNTRAFPESSTREIQIYQQLDDAESLSEFIECIKIILKKLGFSDFSFGYTSREDYSRCNFFGSREDILTIYREKKSYLYDMVVKHCVTSSNPVRTSTLEHFIRDSPFRMELFDLNLELINLYRSFGFDDLFHIPVGLDGDDKKIIFMVAAEGVSQARFYKFIFASRSILPILAEAIHYFGTNKFSEYFFIDSPTTSDIIKPKPLRLLTALARENMLLKDVAASMHISIDTANKQIAAAKHALGANTQSAAVYRAIKEGLINLD